MDANSKLRTALLSLGYPVAFMNYIGTAEKYIVFNIEDERAELFADDEPQDDVVYFQVHFFCPETYDHRADKKSIKVKLFKAGFSYPTIQTFYENETKFNHIVFQTHISGASEREE